MKLTAEKLLANLMNAQLSTGPRTEAGKKRASLNALKHGCSSQTIILPGEDTRHFSKLHFDLKKSFQPANFHEETLVETLAQTQWAINRIRAHENNIFAIGHEQNAGSFDTDDSTLQAALGGAKTMKIELESMKGISIYLQRNSRMYQTTLTQLLTVQALRKAEEEKELATMGKIAMLHQTKKQPFDPALYGSVCPPEKIEFWVRRTNANLTPFPPPSPRTNAA